MGEPYDIQYADEAVADLRALRAYDQRRILDGIERHLTFQPKFVSKSRIKAMVQPFWSQFRLRMDDYRVYYDVDDETRVVFVLRVLMKTNEPTPEEAP
jgi:mRNA-degrading endonuclease RelE of RelBE toxin-antitoxin system